MVKRYEVSEKYIGTGEYVGQMVACSDGDYVEFSDYDALAARLARIIEAVTDGGVCRLCEKRVSFGHAPSCPVTTDSAEPRETVTL